MSISTNRPLGIPAGGLTGQVLAKAGNNNYDFAWIPGTGSPVISVFGRTAVVVAVAGDYNTDQIIETSNLYFTNARTLAAITASSPLSLNSGNLSITQASATSNGYLSSTDWNTFNNKGAGNITSVDVSVPAFLSVSNNPVTNSGTIAITASDNQLANQVLATPDGSTGTLSLRSLVANDIPNLSAAKITYGVLSMDQGGIPRPPYYGLGQLGDVTISSGTTTLTDDYYVNNLTISGTGQLNPNGYRIFVAGTLDLTNAPANAIFRTGNNGGNASGATGGIAGQSILQNTVGGSNGGAVGVTATTGAGGNGTNSSVGSNTLGGQGGAAGSGGAPALAAGGSGGNTSTIGNVTPLRRFDTNLLRGTAYFLGGGGGASGGAGTGDGTNLAGGSGGGGSGAGLIAIYCNILKRDTTTATGAISCLGGAGGNGGNSAGGNSGGGGAGSGAGGGTIYIAYSLLQGNAKTGLIDVSGGAGGAGGNGIGTGRGGQGGRGGAGGRVTLVNMGAGTVSETSNTTTIGAAATTPTTTAGTAGTAGTVLQVTL